MGRVPAGGVHRPPLIQEWREMIEEMSRSRLVADRQAQQHAVEQGGVSR